MAIRKEQLDLWCFDGYYQFRTFKVTDGHKKIWYIAEPVNHGATRLGDTLEELKEKLEKDIPILNRFLQKTR